MPTNTRVGTLRIVLCCLATLQACTGRTVGSNAPPGPAPGGHSHDPEQPGSVHTHGASPDAGPPSIAAPDPFAGPSSPWSAPGTWGGEVPTPKSDVVIPSSRTVILDVDACVQTLVIQGTLVFAEKDLSLCSRWIRIDKGGRLVIGTAERPFMNRANITLIEGDRTENVMEMGTKFLAVMPGGRLDLHGIPGITAWTKLAAPVAAGDTTVEVIDASGWRENDSIVVATGSMEPNETEERTVKAVNGRRVTLDAPLKFPRPLGMTSIEGRMLDLRAAVGRLTRNIRIQGDAASNEGAFGGHTMVMAGAVALVDGVEFIRMGQFNKLARYPFHWHIAGDVSGQYIRNSTVNHSFQRGIVVHSTRKSVVENNIVYDSMGHNFILETGDTVDNVFRHNLAITNRVATHSEPTLFAQNDKEPAGYWIKGAKNTLVDNTAAGSSASGFWYDATAESPTVFRDNTAYAAASRGRADFIRESGLLVQNTSVTTTLEFENVTLFHNQTGLWPTNAGIQIYRNFNFIENGTGSTAETTDDGRARYETPLFVGTLNKANATGGCLSVQYGATVDLVGPTFVNFGDRPLLSSNDINMPWMADVRLEKARLVDSKGGQLPEIGVSEMRDDTYAPKGFYLPIEYPMLATPEMKQVMVTPPGSSTGTPYWMGAKRPIYAVLQTLLAGAGRFVGDGAAGTSYFDYQTIPIQRNDGLEYAFPQGFVFGYPVICNSAFSYQYKSTPPDTLFALQLDLFTGVFQTSEPIAVNVRIPLPAAPKRVVILKSAGVNLEADPGTPLQPAGSLSQFQLSPGQHYYFDPAAGLLHVQANTRAIVVER
jgi:G8 domain/Right handed beta helix region